MDYYPKNLSVLDALNDAYVIYFPGSSNLILSAPHGGENKLQLEYKDL